MVLSTLFWRVRSDAKSDYYLRYICLSVCLSASPFAWNNSPPTGRILVHLRSGTFLKICQESSSLINTNIGNFTYRPKLVWLFLEFFLEWEKFEMKVVEKKSKYNFTSKTFFPPTKSWRLRELQRIRHSLTGHGLQNKIWREKGSIFRQNVEDKNRYRSNIIAYCAGAVICKS